MGSPQQFQAFYNRPAVIHQIQIKYDAMADRLRLQVRTRAGEVFALWLTRRMVQRLWPAFQQVGARLALAGAQPDAVLLPEARAMLAEAVRSRPLPHADFSQPFGGENDRQPLGAEPLLATEVELRPQTGGGLQMRVSESGGRRIVLQLNDELHAALLRLLEQAVAASDWGLAPPAAAAASPEERPPLLS